MKGKPTTPLDLTEIQRDFACETCKLLDWWPEGYLWVHELVILHGTSIPKTAALLSEQISKYNESGKEKHKLMTRDMLARHIRDHIPHSWALSAEVSAELVKMGEIKRGAGQVPPSVAAKLDALAEKADDELLDTIGRIATINEKLEARFHEFDEQYPGALPVDVVPVYERFATAVTKGLDAFIRLRNQDKTLQTLIIRFAERLSIGAMEDAVLQIDSLCNDLRKAGHNAAAEMVATRARDIFVKVLSGNSKKALDDIRATLKTG